MVQAFESFWKRHPALLYGIGMFLGIALVFDPYGLYVWIPITVLILSALSRIWILVFFILFSVGYAHWLVSLPAIGSKPAEGVAYLKISSVSESSTHFGKQYLYRGI